VTGQVGLQEKWFDHPPSSSVHIPGRDFAKFPGFRLSRWVSKKSDPVKFFWPNLDFPRARFSQAEIGPNWRSPQSDIPPEAQRNPKSTPKFPICSTGGRRLLEPLDSTPMTTPAASPLGSASALQQVSTTPSSCHSISLLANGGSRRPLKA
jgi:hypothetical protein